MSASGPRPVIPADESGHHPPNGWIVAVNGRSGRDGLTAKTRQLRTLSPCLSADYSDARTFHQQVGFMPFAWLNKQGVESNQGFVLQRVDRFTYEYRERDCRMRLGGESMF